MRRIMPALIAMVALTNPALAQHRPDGAIDWSPDGSWYPNVRTHPELRMPTQAEANDAYGRFLARGGDPSRLGLASPALPDRLQLFACRPGYFDRHRGETRPHQGWVTCHVFLNTGSDMRPTAKATLNWRWTGRAFELEGLPPLRSQPLAAAQVRAPSSPDFRSLNVLAVSSLQLAIRR